MATLTPVSKIIGSTGASGVNGFITLITTQNSAMATAVTTSQAVSGVVSGSIIIGDAHLSVDTQTNILEMIQTLTYTVSS